MEAFLDRAWGWGFFGGGWKGISILLLPEGALQSLTPGFGDFGDVGADFGSLEDLE